ncbi:uncharacterized protein B0I36DRAFT_243745 [Microdochium trichocladiopsis]|uniref:Transcription factor IIIC 90kDa subunit N-terminal domain-containing protein n=1 Tax=Microdochium trichocladiopsis TaxID=1682393 RepID=A0A9P9BUN8_9PEZI|nr:uncharacterized protein B0I36DRAFT_243745 [Microdochium trichocladiopsis]KAH7031639.1 hypothetical protein B0I36DRAFT_243745 [Microdochium trichocladiopsis]
MATHLPLEPLDLPALPLNTHNIAWSPDLELAVGADDSVYIYLPHFTTIPPSEVSNKSSHGPKFQYNEVALRFPATEARSPEVNRHLFDVVGQDFPHDEDDAYPNLGAGQGPIARTRGTLNHVVALAWSPCGLGRMKRSVLAVLSGSGIITIYCESSLPSNAPSLAVRGRKARTLRPLLVPWLVGSGRYVPVTAAVEHESPEESSLYNPEYVTSMAWAQQLHAPGDGALLAYLNDAHEMVLLAVQAEHGTSSSSHEPTGKWRVEEVARFFAGGPHPVLDPSDPDFVPCGTPFGVSWSPWVSHDGQKSCLVSYVSKNYVGFRRVTVQDDWAAMETPIIEVGGNDCEGLCLHLSTDAFVTWEDQVWPKDGSYVHRGIIASPFRVEAFQVTLDLNREKDDITPHTTEVCGTTYAPEGADSSLNPITGLVIHPSSTLEQNPAPPFSLVRLSATHTNADWFQTNTSSGSSANERPQWATDILLSVGRSLPRSMAYLPRKSFAVDDSDPEDESDEDEDWAFDTYNDGLGGDDTLTKQGEDALSPVYTTRMRVWGMQASPGGGSMAVFVTEHDTIKPERSTFAGLRCKILFGQTHQPGRADLGKDAVEKPRLSTEAQAWEWIYGHGPAPPGVDDAIYDFGSDELKSRLTDVAVSQTCSFCNANVLPTGTHSRCTNGHSFEMCAATNVPILAPGLSNTCGVCNSKCLRLDVIDKMLEAHPHREEILALISPTFCGRCGGKFDD